MDWLLAGTVVALCVIALRYFIRDEERRQAAMTEEERYQEWLDSQW